jgi:electron transfer flavoprotein alpha subunit
LEGRQSRRGEAVIDSDFGIVGDIFKVVPQLIEELKKRKGA